MKRIAGIIFFIIVAFLFFNWCLPAGSEAAADDELKLEDFNGKWYIQYSTFPMWLKGDKKNPSFNYSVKLKDGIRGLHGDVQYVKNGELKHIEGFDQPRNGNNTAFIWRGDGLLHLVKSKWQIIEWNEEQNWAIMHFQRTLFSPEGYDLFSRQIKLDESTTANIRKRLMYLGLSEELKPVHQE